MGVAVGVGVGVLVGTGVGVNVGVGVGVAVGSGVGVWVGVGSGVGVAVGTGVAVGVGVGVSGGCTGGSLTMLMNCVEVTVLLSVLMSVKSAGESMVILATTCSSLALGCRAKSHSTRP